MMKIVKWTLLVSGVLSVIMWALIGDDVDTNQTYIGVLLTISYMLLIISVVVIVVSTLSVLFTHPEQLKRSLITLFILGVVVALSFGLADGTAIETSQGISTEGESIVIGLFLKMFYILLFATIGMMAFFGMKRIIKK